MTCTLVHVGVRASDLSATIRFWRDGLGLQVVAQRPNCYDLTDGWHNFRIFQHSGAPRPAHIGGLLDYLHIGVRVPDLRQAALRCQQLGFQIIWEGLEGSKPYEGGHLPAEAFKIEDPDGIVVDVTELPDQWPGVGQQSMASE